MISYSRVEFLFATDLAMDLAILRPRLSNAFASNLPKIYPGSKTVFVDCRAANVCGSSMCQTTLRFEICVC